MPDDNPEELFAFGTLVFRAFGLARSSQLTAVKSEDLTPITRRQHFAYESSSI